MDEPAIPKKITAEDEIRLLRSQLRELANPSAHHTVTKILMSKHVSLVAYKSLQDKERLLDEAISSGNGDAVLHVVKFLTQTLKKKLVHRILLSRPMAVNHYLHYLTLRLQISECTELLVMLGRHQEAAVSVIKPNHMTKYSVTLSSCCNSKSP
jgi:VPS33B-interacting protein in polarity and apical restriction